MPILELTSRERSDLRSAAHPLKPVVLIGDNGLTEAVLKEIDRALTSHGLIKVRAGGNDRDERESMLASICDTLSCASVHHLGKMLILFRPIAGNVTAPEATGGSTQTRRKSSELHTPKKMAAEGKTLTKWRSRKKITVDQPVAKKKPFVRTELNSSGRVVRPSNNATSSTPAHGIPRRTGSAMSLRAGARTGVRMAARKTTKR